MRPPHPAEVWAQRVVLGLGLALLAHVTFRLTIELGARPGIVIAASAVCVLAMLAIHRQRQT